MIACRNAKKCKAAAEEIKAKTKKSVTPMKCDLSSFRSILEFTKKFSSNYQRLDSLILNAGLSTSNFSITEDNLETMMGESVVVSLQSEFVIQGFTNRREPFWTLSSFRRDPATCKEDCCKIGSSNYCCRVKREPSQLISGGDS